MNNDLTATINAFLFDRSRREYIFKDGCYSHSLLKSSYDDDTDFLYHLDEYQSPHPQGVGQKPEYAGIISYKRAALFDPGYDLRKWGEYAPGRDGLVKCITPKIHTEIHRLVDGKPVDVTDAAESNFRDDREYFEKNEADNEAYMAFYTGRTTVAYTSHFALDNPSTADYVRMINDEEGFIADKARTYIAKKANSINARLWEVSVINERLAKLISTPGEHHLRRKIADSIGDEMKMVNVHIERDGVCGVFKVKAHSVVYAARDNTHISTYSMDAPSERQFQRMFGWREVLQFSDVTRITYGKKELYQREGGDSNDE